ncbi:delta-60 repeat domain-containing protein [uncultured Thiocystis sp.]|jgi:uncharacterized delta-60 repeat protein|uniref:delta-60 repeat domain-containing protein n=1 Tax=uncultured Thiocystis sp. TaxID=1202134 RepID=UPI0025DE726B|nr:delta-60 repeat domain-containing protein [uncultured Thiocystis sp.]
MNDYVYAMALQRDGRIVLAGSARKGTGDKSANFALARYSSNGLLDQSFGVNGRVNTDFFSGDDTVYSIVLQRDGKVVVAGEAFRLDQGRRTAALARYKANGRLDTSFGQQGKVSTVFNADNPDEVHSAVYDLALESNGKIVAGGGTSNNSASDGYNSRSSALARYRTNGGLDFEREIDGVSGAIRGIELRKDGKLVIGANYGGDDPVAIVYFARVLLQ